MPELLVKMARQSCGNLTPEGNNHTAVNKIHTNPEEHRHFRAIS